MNTVLQDLRYAVRMLLKSPGFTAVAVITLALGIGATTTIFSVVDAVLLEAAPFRDPQQLVMVWEKKSGETKDNVVGPANYVRWREQNHSFDDMGAFTAWPMNIVVNGEAERVPAGIATASFFSTLGVSAVTGRTFLPEEEQPGKDNVVLLSYRYWQQRFGGDASVVGRNVVFNGEAMKIVGVMPPRFDLVENVSVWTVLTAGPRLREARGRYLSVVGRVRPGVALAQAQAEMDVVASRTRAELADFDAGWGVHLVPLREQMVGGLRPALLVLLGAVGFVLLIACANVANLLLARASAREKEIAIRAALGVSRGRLIRQVVTESLVLAVAGGGAGVLLAYSALGTIISIVPAAMPGYTDIRLNVGVLGFALAVSLMVGVLFGLAPALRAVHANPQDALKDGGRGTTRPRQRVRNVLVVAEAATALILLAGAGVLMRSFVRLLQVDSGFRADGVLTLQISLASQKYRNREAVVRYFQEAVERVKQAPGVNAAGAVSWLPLDGGGSATNFTVDDRPQPRPGEEPVADVRAVTEDYFRAIGIAFRRGRTFDPSQDRSDDAIKKVVINQRMADLFWPGQDPLGKTLHMEWDSMLRAQVVGVVSDVRLSSLDAQTNRSTLYWYLPQFRNDFMTIVARTKGDPARLVGSVKSQLSALDPEIPIAKIRTMKNVIGESVREPRFTMVLLGTFAGMALLLAGIGLYGVISYSVAQRRHEMGIRLALGAKAADVQRLVIFEGMRLALGGAAIGFAAALVLTRFLAGLVFGVSTRDGITFLAVPIVVCVVALLATYFPARRATKVDPMVALRYE